MAGIPFSGRILSLIAERNLVGLGLVDATLGGRVCKAATAINISAVVQSSSVETPLNGEEAVVPWDGTRHPIGVMRGVVDAASGLAQRQQAARAGETIIIERLAFFTLAGDDIARANNVGLGGKLGGRLVGGALVWSSVLTEVDFVGDVAQVSVGAAVVRVDFAGGLQVGGMAVSELPEGRPIGKFLGVANDGTLGWQVPPGAQVLADAKAYADALITDAAVLADDDDVGIAPSRRAVAVAVQQVAAAAATAGQKSDANRLLIEAWQGVENVVKDAAANQLVISYHDDRADGRIDLVNVDLGGAYDPETGNLTFSVGDEQISIHITSLLLGDGSVTLAKLSADVLKKLADTETELVHLLARARLNEKGVLDWAAERSDNYTLQQSDDVADVAGGLHYDIHAGALSISLADGVRANVFGAGKLFETGREYFIIYNSGNTIGFILDNLEDTQIYANGVVYHFSVSRVTIQGVPTNADFGKSVFLGRAKRAAAAGGADTAAQIRDKLRTLQGDNRLPASALSGFLDAIPHGGLAQDKIAGWSKYKARVSLPIKFYAAGDLPDANNLQGSIGVYVHADGRLFLFVNDADYTVGLRDFLLGGVFSLGMTFGGIEFNLRAAWNADGFIHYPNSAYYEIIAAAVSWHVTDADGGAVDWAAAPPAAGTEFHILSADADSVQQFIDDTKKISQRGYVLRAGYYKVSHFVRTSDGRELTSADNPMAVGQAYRLSQMAYAGLAGKPADFDWREWGVFALAFSYSANATIKHTSYHHGEEEGFHTFYDSFGGAGMNIIFGQDGVLIIDAEREIYFHGVACLDVI